MRRRTASYLYIALVTLGTTVLMVGLLPHEVVPASYLGLAVFILMGILAEWFSVPLPGGAGSVSAGVAVTYAAVVFFGPFLGALVCAFGSLDRNELTGKVAWPTVVFNRAQLALAGAVSGWVIHALAGPDPVADLGRTLWAVLLGGLVYLALNVALLIGHTSVARGADEVRALVSYLRWYFPIDLAVLPFAVLIAVTYPRTGPVGMILFFVPLIAARRAFQLYNEMRDAYRVTVGSLAAALDAKDTYTAGHSERVAQLGVRLARELGMTPAECELLYFAGILHDIGKIGIPDDILKKSGRFTPAEYEIMKEHPVISGKVVQDVEMLGVARLWIRHHHERFDGGGYPDGLVGEEISFGARVLAVADAFDAMISQRPYREMVSICAAREEIRRCAGKQFDPVVVAALERVTASQEFALAWRQLIPSLVE